MPYAAQSDMEALWGKNEVLLSSDWDNTGTTNQGNVTAALAHASNTIDRYVGMQYALPLTPPYPDDLIRCAADIGMFYMCPFATTRSQLKVDRYEAAMKFLRDLANKKATLGSQRDVQNPAVSPATQAPIFDNVQVQPFSDPVSADAMRKLF